MFENSLEKTLAQSPGKAIFNSFSRSRQKEQEFKRRKLLKAQSLSPKKAYQLETKASVNRTSKRTRSLLT
jgi:hypothetical protein